MIEPLHSFETEQTLSQNTKKKKNSEFAFFMNESKNQIENFHI